MSNESKEVDNKIRQNIAEMLAAEQEESLKDRLPLTQTFWALQFSDGTLDAERVNEDEGDAGFSLGLYDTREAADAVIDRRWGDDDYDDDQGYVNEEHEALPTRQMEEMKEEIPVPVQIRVTLVVEENHD